MPRGRPRSSVVLATRPSGVALPRTTAAAAGRDLEPETQTSAQRSGSEPHTDQWWRPPARGFEEMSSSFASECRSANIVRDDAMILPDDATPKPDGIFGRERRSQE